jgi:hypothetical protein
MSCLSLLRLRRSRSGRHRPASSFSARSARFKLAHGGKHIHLSLALRLHCFYLLKEITTRYPFAGTHSFLFLAPSSPSRHSSSTSMAPLQRPGRRTPRHAIQLALPHRATPVFAYVTSAVRGKFCARCQPRANADLGQPEHVVHAAERAGRRNLDSHCPSDDIHDPIRDLCDHGVHARD